MILMAPLTLAKLPTRELEAPVKTAEGSFNWGRHVLIETRILRNMQSSLQAKAACANAPAQRPILMHRGIVPRYLKQNIHTKVAKSDLVVVGAE